MKTGYKIYTFLLTCVIYTSFSTESVCAQNIIDNIKNEAGQMLNGTNNTVTSKLKNIISSSTSISQTNILGTWLYSGSSCAFQSSNLINQAGSSLVAQQIESKLNPTFSKIGISNKNTSFTLNSNNTFSALINGRKITGNYSFNPKNNILTLRTLSFSSNCYVSKSGSNINLLFDANKLLELFRTISQYSGNATLNTISTLSKSYSGSKIGFALKKK